MSGVFIMQCLPISHFWRIASLIFIFLFASIFSGASFAWKMEADNTLFANTTEYDRTFRHITFRQTFDEVPIVVIIGFDFLQSWSWFFGYQYEADPVAFRIKNVTTTGFDVAPVEPSPSDGYQAYFKSVNYFAIEPGMHRLSDNTLIYAGETDVTKHQGLFHIMGLF